MRVSKECLASSEGVLELRTSSLFYRANSVKMSANSSRHKIFNGQNGCIDQFFLIITLGLPREAYIYRIEVL